VDDVTIGRLDGAAVAAAADELAGLIIDAVTGGASVGFARPPTDADARAWVAGVAADVEAGSAILLVARLHGAICGTVQLRFASSENGRHRAEVSKLMVHHAARSRGIGTRLMGAVEAAATAAGLRTLVLDTESGSDAERLYQGLGWNLVGLMPEYAESPAGGLRSTSFYYRLI
jgi:ribosomal protein S18 acetylase RimI-like enzyme